jgi:hypothetical protein
MHPQQIHTDLSKHFTRGRQPSPVPPMVYAGTRTGPVTARLRVCPVPSQCNLQSRHQRRIPCVRPKKLACTHLPRKKRALATLRGSCQKSPFASRLARIQPASTTRTVKVRKSTERTADYVDGSAIRATRASARASAQLAAPLTEQLGAQLAVRLAPAFESKPHNWERDGAGKTLSLERAALRRKRTGLSDFTERKKQQTCKF